MEAAWGLLSVLFSGGIAAIITALIARKKAKSEIKKTEAETAEIITRAAQNAVETLQNQICNLKSEIDRLRERVTELEAMCEQFDEVLTGAHMLHEQIVLELHGTPKYHPPERRVKS